MLSPFIFGFVHLPVHSTLHGMSASLFCGLSELNDEKKQKLEMCLSSLLLNQVGESR